MTLAVTIAAISERGVNHASLGGCIDRYTDLCVCANRDRVPGIGRFGKAARDLVPDARRYATQPLWSIKADHLDHGWNRNQESIVDRDVHARGTIAVTAALKAPSN